MVTQQEVSTVDRRYYAPPWHTAPLTPLLTLVLTGLRANIWPPTHGQVKFALPLDQLRARGNIKQGVRGKWHACTLKSGA